MRFVVYFILIVVVSLLTVSCARTISRHKKEKQNDSAHLIATVDLSSGNYSVKSVLAEPENGTESFESMVARTSPYIAINGTYFDENNRNLGDIVSDGKLIASGNQRQGIGVTASGKIGFISRTGGVDLDWSGYSWGIACGPKLITDGKKDIDPVRDGFSEKACSVMAPRTAIGATDDHTLFLCVVPRFICLDELADILLENGVVQAINLDGGRSCALYVDGKFEHRPASKLTNMIIIDKK